VAVPKEKNNSLVCLGEIVSAHGIKGAVNIKTYTENPKFICNFDSVYDSDGVSYNLKFISAKSAYIIASIEGVSDRNAAEELIGKKLFLERNALPEISDGEFYYEDLIGLEVRSRDGKSLGSVHYMHNFGAGDIIEINLSNGKSEMILFNDDNVPEVNIPDGYIIVDMPDFIFAAKDKG